MDVCWSFTVFYRARFLSVVLVCCFCSVWLQKEFKVPRLGVEILGFSMLPILDAFTSLSQDGTVS